MSAETDHVRGEVRHQWSRLDHGWQSYARGDVDGQYRETVREIERMALMLQQMAEALVKTADLIEEADREAAGLFELSEMEISSSKISEMVNLVTPDGETMTGNGKLPAMASLPPLRLTNLQALNRYANALNNSLPYADLNDDILITENTFTIDQLEHLKILVEDMRSTLKYGKHAAAFISVILGALAALPTGGQSLTIGAIAAGVWEIQGEFEESQLEDLSMFLDKLITVAEKNGVDEVTLRTSYQPFFSKEDWWTGVGICLDAFDAQGKSISPTLVLTGGTGFLIMPFIVAAPQTYADFLHSIDQSSLTWE